MPLPCVGRQERHVFCLLQPQKNPLSFCAGLVLLTALDISKLDVRSSLVQLQAGKPQLTDEIRQVCKLKNLRHLSLSCCLPLLWKAKKGKKDRLSVASYIPLDRLAGLTNLAFLNLCPLGQSAPFVKSPGNAKILEVWKGLKVLKHLPLQELYVGVLAPQPPHPYAPETCAFY